MYLTYYVYLVGIKKKRVTAKMHGVESFKYTYVRSFSFYYGKIKHYTLWHVSLCSMSLAEPNRTTFQTVQCFVLLHFHSTAHTVC